MIRPEACDGIPDLQLNVVDDEPNGTQFSVETVSLRETRPSTQKKGRNSVSLVSDGPQLGGVGRFLILCDFAVHCQGRIQDFCQGASRVLTPGALTPKFAQNSGFPLKIV